MGIATAGVGDRTGGTRVLMQSHQQEQQPPLPQQAAARQKQQQPQAAPPDVVGVAGGNGLGGGQAPPTLAAEQYGLEQERRTKGKKLKVWRNLNSWENRPRKTSQTTWTIASDPKDRVTP